ncbi:hypothetical protein MPER_02602 [Moniliophthora perniciosa FA553]|nr:hypothetical protein MPER_02602 [Moniliophthora perniciosa FA553]
MANTILFITNSEHGQANVILAVAHELAQRPDVEVHVASFSKLQNRVAKLSMLLPDASNAIQFHAIDGLDYKSRLARQVSVHEVAHPAGYGVLQGYRWIAYTLMPWKLEEYHRRLPFIEQIVDQVEPTGIVMEP